MVATALLVLGACTLRPAPSSSPVPSSGLAPSNQTPWVRDRVQALERLYPFTAAGQQWLESFDLRQMVGQPGWFGANLQEGWAGVGQAIPVTILHELGHSYYGAFPVTGRPDLSWRAPSANEPSPALRQYQEDLKTFVAQPPDRYEPLRDRFRNLPNLSLPKGPDLFHFGEAELLYMVGGNLDLIPPILRKYYDRFLEPGEFHAWEQAIRWYLGLSKEEAKLADGYFGLTHFPLARYQGLRPNATTRVASEIRAILEGEEQQRLRDFAYQYDLIKEKEFGPPGPESFEASFKFWRGLLREMLGLHRKYPQTLAQEGGAKGAQIATAFDTILQAEKLPQAEQVRLLQQSLDQPLMRDFTALLKNKALVDLVGLGPARMPEEPIEAVALRFTEKLKAYLEETDKVVALGRQEPSQGVRALERFLAKMTDEEQKENLDLPLGMLREADAAIARETLNGIGDSAVIRMVRNNPGAAKNGHVRPERLLSALEVQPEKSRRQLVAGIRWLLENTAGNFQIDAPFTNLAHRVIADVAARSPEDALSILEETQLPLVAQPYSPLLMDYPEVVARVLGSDVNRAAALIATRQGYAETPHGIVHALIYHDPALAAELVISLSNSRQDQIVWNSMVVFAYDARRLAAYPGIKLSLANDKRFLEHLMEAQGERWVTKVMGEAIKQYGANVQRQSIDEEYLLAYAETLAAMLALERDPAKQRAMRRTFVKAFQDAGQAAIAPRG